MAGAGGLWRLAEETEATIVGVSPAYLMACRKAGVRDPARAGSSALATAGSPLPAEGYDYVYEQLGPDVLLINGSGGTDVCSAIVSGCPMLPVYRGEIAGRCLGVDTAAYDVDGNEVVGELGELVIRQPMPSMPVQFWNDAGGERYRGVVLRHVPGRLAPGRLGAVLRAGHVRHHRPLRRDAQPRRCPDGHERALRGRRGVRRGRGQPRSCTSRTTRAGPGELVLFVVADLDDDLRARIAGALRSELSPRHVPDTIAAVPAIPRTLTGKKLEAPVKRILRGAAGGYGRQ